MFWSLSAAISVIENTQYVKQRREFVFNIKMMNLFPILSVFFVLARIHSSRRGKRKGQATRAGNHKNVWWTRQSKIGRNPNKQHEILHNNDCVLPRFFWHRSRKWQFNGIARYNRHKSISKYVIKFSQNSNTIVRTATHTHTAMYGLDVRNYMHMYIHYSWLNLSLPPKWIGNEFGLKSVEEKWKMRNFSKWKFLIYFRQQMKATKGKERQPTCVREEKRHMKIACLQNIQLQEHTYTHTANAHIYSLHRAIYLSTSIRRNPISDNKMLHVFWMDSFSEQLKFFTWKNGSSIVFNQSVFI